jgi:hypothetical protein
LPSASSILLALGLLAVLVALNGLVSWVLRRPFLRPHEILIVYTMTVLAAMIASRGLIEKLLPALVAINYFANPQNRWAEAFFPHIPKWLVPFDPKGMEAQPPAKYFYEGSKGVVVWSEWLTPLLAWSVVVAGVWMCFLAIAAIWRRQWADHEKLNFPLTQPPLQLIEPSKPFKPFAQQAGLDGIRHFIFRVFRQRAQSPLSYHPANPR